jgi:hypothetical protein
LAVPAVQVPPAASIPAASNNVPSPGHDIWTQAPADVDRNGPNGKFLQNSFKFVGKVQEIFEFEF